MRTSRFSEEKIIAILKESEARVGTEELCRRHHAGVFLAVEGEFGGMEVPVNIQLLMFKIAQTALEMRRMVYTRLEAGSKEQPHIGS